MNPKKKSDLYVDKIDIDENIKKNVSERKIKIFFFYCFIFYFV